MKIRRIPHVIFGTKNHLFFKLCITLQCHATQLFCTFSSKTLYALNKRSLWKSKFLDLQLLASKLTRFIMSCFKPRVCFPLNSASPFSVITHVSTWSIICLGQKEVIKVQLFNFWVPWWKLTQFLMQFSKPQDQSSFKSFITVQCHER